MSKGCTYVQVAHVTREIRQGLDSKKKHAERMFVGDLYIKYNADMIVVLVTFPPTIPPSTCSQCSHWMPPFKPNRWAPPFSSLPLIVRRPASSSLEDIYPRSPVNDRSLSIRIGDRTAGGGGRVTLCDAHSWDCDVWRSQLYFIRKKHFPQ